MPNEEMGSRALPETPDVDNRVVIATIGGFLLFVAIAMAGIFYQLKTEAPGALRRPNEHQFPQPSLQKAPRNDLQQFESRQRAELSGYGWVDRGQGLAKIPIEDAMRIIAARGEHGYDPLDSPAAAVPPTDQGAQR